MDVIDCIDLGVLASQLPKSQPPWPTRAAALLDGIGETAGGIEAEGVSESRDRRMCEAESASGMPAQVSLSENAGGELLMRDWILADRLLHPDPVDCQNGDEVRVLCGLQRVREHEQEYDRSLQEAREQALAARRQIASELRGDDNTALDFDDNYGTPHLAAASPRKPSDLKGSGC